MLTEIYRLIKWMKNYGFSEAEILNMLKCVTHEDSAIQSSDAADLLETSFQRAISDPVERAGILCDLIRISPEEEIEPEAVLEQLQLFPILLRTIREIVEESNSKSEIIRKVDVLIQRVEVLHAR